MNNHTENLSNLTSPRTLDSMIDKSLLKIEVLTLTLVFVLSFGGNSIVVVTLIVRSFLKRRKSRFSNSKQPRLTRMNFFILNLSLADIYVSLGNILTMLLWRKNNNIFFGGYVACK